MSFGEILNTLSTIDCCSVVTNLCQYDDFRQEYTLPLTETKTSTKLMSTLNTALEADPKGEDSAAPELMKQVLDCMTTQVIEHAYILGDIALQQFYRTNTRGVLFMLINSPEGVVKPKLFYITSARVKHTLTWETPSKTFVDLYNPSSTFLMEVAVTIEVCLLNVSR